MTTYSNRWTGAATTLCFMLSVVGYAPAQSLPRVTIATDFGDIVIEVDTVRAPVTAGNFLAHVDAGHYTGAAFYRTVTPDNQPGQDVKIEVIQGGLGNRAAGFAPIPLERTSVTGLRHADGTLSMARAGPDTATTEIFICINAQPELDFGGRRNPDGQGFAAFGQVVQGMDVVRAIQREARDGQTLTPPVMMRSVTRR